MTDIIPQIIADPDNAVYSARVMGYGRRDHIEGRYLSTEEDISHWTALNGTLEIVNGDVVLRNSSNPATQQQKDNYINDLKKVAEGKGYYDPYQGGYPMFYQEVPVVKGGIYALTIQRAGANDIISTLFHGTHDSMLASIEKGYSILQLRFLNNDASYTQVFLARENVLTLSFTCDPVQSCSVHYANITSTQNAQVDNEGNMTETWFPSYSQQIGRHLKYWGNSMQVLFPIGRDLSGWINHVDFGLCFISPQVFQEKVYPEIWLWFNIDCLNLSPHLDQLGWLKFSREMIGLSNSQFYNTGIAGHENGEGIVAFSEKLQAYILFVKTSSGKIYAKINGTELFVEINFNYIQ